MLDGFGAYPAVIQRELDRYLPFLATTKVLIAAVRAGMGREVAHEVIRSTPSRSPWRCGSAAPNRTCSTGSRPTRGCRWTGGLDAALADKQSFTGAAGAQVDAVAAAVEALVRDNPEAAKYVPGTSSLQPGALRPPDPRDTSGRAVVDGGEGREIDQPSDEVVVIETAVNLSDSPPRNATRP